MLLTMMLSTSDKQCLYLYDLVVELPCLRNRQAMWLTATWCALLVLLGAPVAHGQGLKTDDKDVLRAGVDMKSFTEVYGKVETWRTAMSVSTVSACRQQAGSLCASSLSDTETLALKMAAAPQQFDARATVSVGAVKDQGNCGTCVAFVVLATAKTAAAMSLRINIQASLSEHDFYFCRTADKEFERNCEQGMNMKDGIAAFVRLQGSRTLPVLDSCLPYDPGSGANSCRQKCPTTIPELLRGTFRGRTLTSIMDMQRQIRDHGSIMCGLQLYTDTRAFFKANPDGIWTGPGPAATPDTAHAVQVVGYDNRRKAWLIKNTWGQDFGVEGFAWVSFNAPGMCSRDNTYGIVFTPNTPPPPLPVKIEPAEVAGREKCYKYTAIPADYPERIASRFGIQIQQLLLDNLDVIKDPSTVPPGTVLTLCGITSSAVGGVARGSLARQEQRAAPAGTPAASCPRCEPRRFLSVRVCRAMTLIIKSRNPTTGRVFDTSWDFNTQADLNTYFNLQTNNVNIEVDPAATEWREPGDDWRRMNMVPEKVDCSKPCSCCGVTQRYRASFNCGGGTATQPPAPRPSTPQTCPPCTPRDFLTVKVCRPGRLIIKSRDTSNGNTPFQGEWTYAAGDKDLGQRHKLVLDNKEIEIDRASTDWRSDQGNAWQRVNMMPLNGTCAGTCNCCGVRQSWYAEFNCGNASAPSPSPNSRTDPACPACVPYDRLVVKVCKPNKLSVRSRNPRTGRPVVDTWEFTQPSQLNRDIRLSQQDVPIEIDPAATDYRVEGSDWQRMNMSRVTGKCEGLCSCCGTLLNHYATFDC